MAVFVDSTLAYMYTFCGKSPFVAIGVGLQTAPKNPTTATNSKIKSAALSGVTPIARLESNALPAEVEYNLILAGTSELTDVRIAVLPQDKILFPLVRVPEETTNAVPAVAGTQEPLLLPYI